MDLNRVNSRPRVGHPKSTKVYRRENVKCPTGPEDTYRVLKVRGVNVQKDREKIVG